MTSKTSRCAFLAVAAFLAIVVSVADPNHAQAGEPCLNCPRVHNSPHAVHGQEIVVADGHGGLRSVVGSASSCSGCAWKIVPECAYHPSSNGGDNACSNATSGYVCTTRAGQPGIPYRAFFSPPPNAAWILTGNVCVGAKEKPVSLDAILAKVRLLADQLVPPSTRLILQPGGGLALVQLPTIMRADGPQTAAKKFFVDAGAPIAVAVAVRATSWTWQVDSTAVLTTNYPGRAYQYGHSPRTEPDYYASHTFTQTGPTSSASPSPGPPPPPSADSAPFPSTEPSPAPPHPSPSKSNKPAHNSNPDRPRAVQKVRSAGPPQQPSGPARAIG